jgi:hypothetical protein
MTPTELNGKRLRQVDSGFAVGGLVINRGKVIECAPIFRKWFLGRATGTVRQMIRKRNWKLAMIPPRRVN